MKMAAMAVCHLILPVPLYEADHVVRKVGIQAHARREREGQVGAEAHAQAYGLIEADA